MIGNDIVDVSLASKSSNWQHPRFLGKLFAPFEQELITNYSNKFTAIWKLWSLKEAAYKAYVQYCPGRFYNPKSFVCSGIDNLVEVRYKDFSIMATTFTHMNYIYAQTTTHNEVTYDIFSLKEMDNLRQSVELRQALLKRVSSITGIKRELLNIKKSEFGIPQIYQDDSKLNIEASLTHHGSYAAYSFIYK